MKYFKSRIYFILDLTWQIIFLIKISLMSFRRVFVFPGPRHFLGPRPWPQICIYRPWPPICIYRHWPPICIYRTWHQICIYQPWPPIWIYRPWPSIFIYRLWPPTCVYPKFVFTGSTRPEFGYTDLVSPIVFTSPGLWFVRTQATC